MDKLKSFIKQYFVLVILIVLIILMFAARVILDDVEYVYGYQTIFDHGNCNDRTVICNGCRWYRPVAWFRYFR